MPTGTRVGTPCGIRRRIGIVVPIESDRLTRISTPIITDMLRVMPKDKFTLYAAGAAVDMAMPSAMPTLCATGMAAVMSTPHGMSTRCGEDIPAIGRNCNGGDSVKCGMCHILYTPRHHTLP